MPITRTIQERVFCKYCGKELALGYKIMHEQKFCFKRPKIAGSNIAKSDAKNATTTPSILPSILVTKVIPVDTCIMKCIERDKEINNMEAIMVEKPKNGKEVKELKVEVEETVKKQQIEAEKAEKKRREEIRSVVQEMLSEIKEKEQEVKLAEVDVDEVVKKGKDKDKIGDKKDELIELRKELNDLKKEYSDLQIKLKENEEDRHKKEGAIKRGIVSMFGSWIIF